MGACLRKLDQCGRQDQAFLMAPLERIAPAKPAGAGRKRAIDVSRSANCNRQSTGQLAGRASIGRRHLCEADHVERTPGRAVGGARKTRRDMTSYIFDAQWKRQRARLRSLEALFDRASVRYLAELGVVEGWRCLEVGCGAGGIAFWLADRVGRTGRVVATDLDTHFIDGRGQPHLHVRKHNIMIDPIVKARSIWRTRAPWWSTFPIMSRPSTA
jgi:hypothetical protein